MADLVVVDTFSDRVSAELARAHLDAHGIRAFVVDATSFNPLLTDAAGGVRLSVAATDEEMARGLLRERQERALRDDEKDEDDDPTAQVVRCPRCELEYCFFEAPRFLGGASLLDAFLRRNEKRWRCRSCGHAWDDEHEGPKRRTQLPEGEPKAVFRLERSRGGVASFFGLMAGFVVGVTTGTPLFIVAGLGGLAGRLIGGSLGYEVCSDPKCRASLPADAANCARCGGVIWGRVDSAGDHWIRTAEYRREVAARIAQVGYRRDAKRRKKKAARAPLTNGE